MLCWHKNVILIGIRNDAFLLVGTTGIEFFLCIMSSAPCNHEDTTAQSEKASASDSTILSNESSEEDSDLGTALEDYSIHTIHTFLPEYIDHSISSHHGIIGKQQIAVSSPENSKKRAMSSREMKNEYRSDREMRMKLYYQKKVELDRGSISMGTLPSSSTTFASTKTEQRNYACTTCKKVIKVDCSCLRRSLRLHALEEMHDGLALVAEELHEMRSFFKKTQSIKRTREKLKKMIRSKASCLNENKEGRLCYNCNLPITGGCKCFKISTRIPFDLWANDSLTKSDLKQQLSVLFENKVSIKKGNANHEEK